MKVLREALFYFLVAGVVAVCYLLAAAAVLLASSDFPTAGGSKKHRFVLKSKANGRLTVGEKGSSIAPRSYSHPT